MKNQHLTEKTLDLYLSEEELSAEEYEMLEEVIEHVEECETCREIIKIATVQEVAMEPEVMAKGIRTYAYNDKIKELIKRIKKGASISKKKDARL